MDAAVAKGLGRVPHSLMVGAAGEDEVIAACERFVIANNIIKSRETRRGVIDDALDCEAPGGEYRQGLGGVRARAVEIDLINTL